MNETMPCRPYTVATGLAFGEAPRWHDHALWWSDMHAREVYRAGAAGVEKICDIPGRPSGLGWLPDGRLMVVSMEDKRILRLDGDGSLVVHADLSGLVPRRLNDMIVDAQGRAYVGNFGFELDGVEPPAATVLVRVDPDGSTHVVAEDLLFPNGMVITDEGRTLVVAETWGARLTAFAIGPAGELSRRRIWAHLEDGAVPDGICLDVEGAIWVASPTTNDCLRLAEGGDVLERIPIGRSAFACTLGGKDGRTLFVCTADSHDPKRQNTERNGRVEGFPVTTRGFGHS